MANFGTGTGSGSPCGACKFLRRKCVSDCIFAPYFGCEQGSARFAAIHKVFGASNVSKLLFHVPVRDRCEAAVTVAYEAQARIRDPVYGCVAHIIALQQQVAMLQVQLMQARARLVSGMVRSQSLVHQWQGNVESNPYLQPHPNLQSASPHGCFPDGSLMEEDLSIQACSKRRLAPRNYELGELQAVALKMTRD